MGKTNTTWLLAGLLSTVLLGSCGGGGGFAGIDGSGVKPELSVSGPINGFGSVIVNGVHYATDDAKILVRGQPADEVDLNVGYYVTVVGGVNESGEAVAYEVHYQPRVTGPVQWVDKDRNRFAVLGQVVQLLGDTVYSSEIMPRNIDGLIAGTKVSVSGPLDADHIIQATRVELDWSSMVELVGLVEKLDVFARTFVINGQTVSYSPILATTKLVNGRLVEVRGSVTDGVLVADELTFNLDYRRLRNIPAIELSGFVRNLTLDGRFQLDSVPIRATSATVYSGGVANSITANSKVRVVGALDASDVLVAKEIEILSSPDMKVYGEIQEVYPIWSSYGAIGKIKVQNQEFLVQMDTRLIGEYEQRIGFYHLRVGDLVYVSGYARNDKQIATSVAVDNRDMHAASMELQGVAYLVSPPNKSFFLFNTKVTVTPDTQYSQSGLPMEEPEFFAAVLNKYVRVRGHYENGILIASHIQIFSPEYDRPFWMQGPPWPY